MRCNEPQALTSILTQASSLSQIQDRAVILSKLTNLVNNSLPEPLNQHCRVANYRQGVLVLEVSTASWLTRLKYEQSDLLSVLRTKALASLSSIEYRINPDIFVNYQNVKKQSKNDITRANVMTQESAMFLYTLAENAPEILKKQLIKLAKHAK